MTGIIRISYGAGRREGDWRVSIVGTAEKRHRANKQHTWTQAGVKASGKGRLPQASPEVGHAQFFIILLN